MSVPGVGPKCAMVWDHSRQVSARLQLLALSTHSSLGELQITPAFTSGSAADRLLTWLPKHLTITSHSTGPGCFCVTMKGRWSQSRYNQGRGDLWSTFYSLKPGNLSCWQPGRPVSQRVFPIGSDSRFFYVGADAYMKLSSVKKKHHNVSPITPYMHIPLPLPPLPCWPKGILWKPCRNFNLHVPPPTASMPPPTSHPQPSFPWSPLSQSEEEEQQGGVEENRGKEIDEEPFWYTAAGKGRENWLNLDENYIKGRVHLQRWTRCMHRGVRSPVHMYDLRFTVIQS